MTQEDTGSSYFSFLDAEILMKLAAEASVTLVLLEAAEEWFMANYMRIPAEKREEHEKEGKMNKNEKLAVISSLVGF